MSTYNYGKFSIYLSYESIIFVIMGYAVHASIKNAKYDFKTQYEDYLSNCIYLICCSFFIWILFVNIFSNTFEKYLDMDIIVLNCLMIHSFCTAIITFYSEKVALDYEYKKYLILSLLSTLINVTLSIFFIIFIYKTNSYLGRVLGSVISYVVIVVYILYYFLKNNHCRLNISFWKYALKISLPIIPHGLSQIVLSSFDRIMISNISGASQAGIYSMTYTVGSIIQVLFAAAERVWTPWFFEKMATGNSNEIKKKANILLFFISAITSGVIVISPEIIMLLAPESYWEGKNIVGIILLGIYFSIIYMLPSNVEYYYKKTNYIAVGTTCAAIINIILNAIFIPRYGYMAATYTTLFTYILYFVFHMCIANTLLNEKLYDIKRIIICTASTCLVTLVSLLCLNVIIVRLFIDFLILLLIIFKLIHITNTK